LRTFKARTMRARVEIFYFGCCPWSYFLGYGGGFLDETWATISEVIFQKCFLEEPAFPDPTGKGGILVHRL